MNRQNLIGYKREILFFSPVLAPCMLIKLSFLFLHLKPDP